MLGMQGLHLHLHLDLDLDLDLDLYLHLGGFWRASARHEHCSPSRSSIRSGIKKATRAQSGGFFKGRSALYFRSSVMMRTIRWPLVELSGWPCSLSTLTWDLLPSPLTWI